MSWSPFCFESLTSSLNYSCLNRTSACPSHSNSDQCWTRWDWLFFDGSLNPFLVDCAHEYDGKIIRENNLLNTKNIDCAHEYDNVKIYKKNLLKRRSDQSKIFSSKSCCCRCRKRQQGCKRGNNIWWSIKWIMNSFVVSLDTKNFS